MLFLQDEGGEIRTFPLPPFFAPKEKCFEIKFLLHTRYSGKSPGVRKSPISFTPPSHPLPSSLILRKGKKGGREERGTKKEELPPPPAPAKKKFLFFFFLWDECEENCNDDDDEGERRKQGQRKCGVRKCFFFSCADPTNT